MIDTRNTEGIYFVGIGGIGMSALALYFAKGGFAIAGYDRSESSLTESLIQNGCDISFEDRIETLPALFSDLSNKNRVIVIYTPAISAENNILTWFRNNGYSIFKRSEILGEISSRTDVLAVAGTHGKTTVSAMIAHILKQSHLDCSAFLGGISKNYGTNLLVGEGKLTVIEADEFDRSFHRLTPMMAVITSIDADHLDVYGDHLSMIKAYNEFCSKISKGGTLLINSKISAFIDKPEGVNCCTYGSDAGSDYRAVDIEKLSDYYRFNLQTPDGIIKDLHFPFPGIINIENLTAAIAIALMCGVTEDEIRKAVLLFLGVKRRFDIRVNLPNLTYVDDYAHHPEEIKAFITSVKEYFKGRKITGIFQPHLYSRTRDHAAGFAASLDELDEVILLPVYPAREKAIPGVSSGMIYEKMKLDKKRMLKMEDLPARLDTISLDVLLTIGAGDIDRLVEPIEEMLKRRKGR
ncbi:MAG TPA: UDP-N-acetylmuramate--L-alanine ligase [Bacteroidales bacterium]|nr:UDP-N-acetylmuramate--L-alanine ligase [Bacteroidales bacterium]